MRLLLPQTSEHVRDSANSLSKLLRHPGLSTTAKKKFLPQTVSSFRKQTTPFSITLSTPTCDLINIYTLCLPQGRGVRDVVILLIGASTLLSSAPPHDHPQANNNTNVMTLPLCTRLTATFVSSVPCGFNWLEGGGGGIHFNPSMTESIHCTDLYFLRSCLPRCIIWL